MICELFCSLRFTSETVQNACCAVEWFCRFAHLNCSEISRSLWRGFALNLSCVANAPVMTVGRRWQCEHFVQILRAVRRSCAFEGFRVLFQRWKGGQFVSVVTLRGGVAFARADILVLQWNLDCGDNTLYWMGPVCRMMHGCEFARVAGLFIL